MTENIIHKIDERLESWADWYLRHCHFGLGYPNKNIIAAIQESGGIMSKTTGTVYPPDNPDAEEIEALVRDMAEQNDKMATALRTYYFKNGKVEYKAKSMGMSYANFKIYVDKAKQWLAGRLTANRKL